MLEFLNTTRNQLQNRYYVAQFTRDVSEFNVSKNKLFLYSSFYFPGDISTGLRENTCVLMAKAKTQELLNINPEAKEKLQ